MTMRVATLSVTVRFDDRITDADAIAVAADRLLETALSTPGIMAEYGDPTFGEFEVSIGPDA